MRINKTNSIYEKSPFKINQNSILNEDKNQIKSDNDSNPNNTPTDLSSPAPSFLNQKNQKINKDKFYKMLEVEFDKENFRLFFYFNEENKLVIELIPKDGNVPFSYKNIFDEEKFYKMNKIFMELKTVEKIGEKIVNLFKKQKVLLGKNRKEEIFYIILKITVIDEDLDIFIPLNKNDEIQLCTINYLLKESEKLKKDFSEYKNETEELIKNQKEEINELKKINTLYLNIIEKIRNEYNEEKNFEDNKGNEIIINEEIKKDNKNYDEENDELKKINEIIIDEDDEYKNIEKKIEVMENELKVLDRNYKCDISAKYKILSLSINQTKPHINIYFELLNTGLFPLTSKLDDIFCNIEDINEESISFYDEQERYIFLPEPLLPQKKLIISKKIIINNPIINRKYDFLLNIYTLNQGKISKEPIRFNIYIRENEAQKNFLSILRNKKFELNKENKKGKIILEYANISDEKEENNFKPVNTNKITENNNTIKIRRFIYDENSGMALEDKNKNLNNNDKIEFKDDINLTNNKLEINIVVNKDEVEKIRKKLKNKYKHLKEFDKEKIEEIICSCLGDFNTISNFIEKMI